ncbi:MAG: acyltransferase [Alphaproteobacteria bacterium]|nr:acyltransferase [Alphaproteobacteria bacterium]
MPRTATYRPDIDALRAVAVLAVVLFHYRVPGFGGGFVGVDVFFVISGYLITGLIQKEMDEGRFSLRQFYERRIRRIFPALFVMLAAATLAAALLFFPASFARFGRSLLSTAFFSANFEFWREAGYFDVGADQKPLLHLWSIAVEEQFYLVFPALLLLIGARAKAQLALTVAAVLSASLIFSIWSSRHASAAGYYLLPSRMWELMLGALLAIAVVRVPTRFKLNGIAAAAGLALIGYAVFRFSHSTLFPGAAALVPCVGTALIVAAGEGAALTRVLRLRPVVFVGLISYSLYLWHWPIYVFARAALFRTPTPVETVLLLGLSFWLAVLSWRYIEQPFRSGNWGWPRQMLFRSAGLAMAVAAACAAVLIFGEGLPQRFSPEIRMILAEAADHEPRIGECFGLTAEDVRKGRLCPLGAKVQKASFLLWGDSHADALIPAVQSVAKHAGRAGLFAGTDSCPPLLGVKRADTAKCAAFNDAVAKIATSKGIREVILEARWAKNAEGTSFGQEPAGRVRLYDDVSPGRTERETRDVFYRGLHRTVQALSRAGKKVVLVASVPEVGFPVPAYLARAKMADPDAKLTMSAAAYRERQKFVLWALAQMHRRYGAQVVYPDRVICQGDTCRVALNGRPLYRDAHHLSVFGAKQLTPLLAQVF